MPDLSKAGWEDEVKEIRKMAEGLVTNNAILPEKESSVETLDATKDADKKALKAANDNDTMMVIFVMSFNSEVLLRLI